MAAHLLRRAALRALASAPQLGRNQSTVSAAPCITRPNSRVIVSSFKPSPFAQTARRAYATEDKENISESNTPIVKEEVSAADSPIEAAPEHARAAARRFGASEETQSSVGAAAQRVTNAARSASQAVSQGISSVTDSLGGGGRGSPGGGFGRPEAEPSKSLYIGNLYFEVTEGTLKKEFSKFGNISNVKIIFDARGLSKGFGYVDFENQSDAEEARRALDGQVLEGRRLAVQYAVSKGGRRPDRGDRDGGRSRGGNADGSYVNEPSKTLFIGNMSYEMTDKDLNDLFREVKNVLDVRVAIDRRTGQPRGFAHADFTDTKSAQQAAEYLKSKEFYGRSLRIDFSASSATTRGPREPRE